MSKKEDGVTVKNYNGSGFGCGGFALLLAIAFIVLKLVGQIEWTWFWVLAPLWILAAVSVVIITVIVVFLVIAGLDQEE